MRWAQNKSIGDLGCRIRDFDCHLLGVCAWLQYRKHSELIGAVVQGVFFDLHGAVVERCEAGEDAIYMSNKGHILLHLSRRNGDLDALLDVTD